MTLRLSEHYVSVQGEGPRTGILTQFVRFAGCNMRCPGWPCDTQHAIQPEIWRHESEKVTATDLALRIEDKFHETGAKNICWTGGEPFLQPNDELLQVGQVLFTPNPNVPDLTFEVFTNGSFEFPRWTDELLIMMDWKLRGSGEADTQVGTRRLNALKHLKGSDGIKFVVRDLNDLEEAVVVWHNLTQNGCLADFWVGRVWDAPMTNDGIIKFVIANRLPWKLNVQMHKYVWDPNERGV